ncbi:MAG: J domain-containing protein [Akkermansiaceae bacterium]|jgi:hypothetical protein|nr:J domain-containing protein [Akkermansiaceae bacterium]
MPWETLNLDPATATVRDVKKAYATRLKTCRPDQDPESFRKLHEAYTLALHEIETRGKDPSPPELPIPETPAPTAEPQEPAVLSPISGSLDRLATALELGAGDIATLLREAEAEVRKHPAEILTWGERIFDLIQRHPDHPDLRLKPEAILFELEHQGLAATLAIIGRADLQGNQKTLGSLSKLLLENSLRIGNPAGGLAAARLACAVAFWCPNEVSDLSDFAYSTLARGERDHHMAMIDQHGGMRQFLRSAPDSLLSFLRQRLLQPGDGSEWYTPEGTTALVWLGRIRRRAPDLYDTFAQLLPPELATEHPPVRPLNELEPPAHSTSTSGGGNEDPPLRWQPKQSKQGTTRKGGPQDPFEASFDDPGSPPQPAKKSPAPPPSPARPASKPSPKEVPASAPRSGGHGDWLNDEIQPQGRKSKSVSQSDTAHPPRSSPVKAIIFGIFFALFVIRILWALLREIL